MNAVQPEKIKTLDFYGPLSHAALVRAIAYRSAWKLGKEMKMSKLGRRILRLWMRSAAQDAVRSVKMAKGRNLT